MFKYNKKKADKIISIDYFNFIGKKTKWNSHKGWNMNACRA